MVLVSSKCKLTFLSISTLLRTSSFSSNIGVECFGTISSVAEEGEEEEEEEELDLLLIRRIENRNRNRNRISM